MTPSPNWKRRRRKTLGHGSRAAARTPGTRTSSGRATLERLISLWEQCAPTLAIHWARRPQALGRLGEQLAARHLAALGWTVLGRSVKTPFAEIDLVCLEGDRLVCVEVKTGRIRTDRPSRMLPRDRLRPRRLRCQERAARHLAQRYRLPLNRCRVDLFEWSLRGARGSAWCWLQGTHLRDVVHSSSRPSGEPF